MINAMTEDLLWHQNGAEGLIPSNRIDGALYHYGRQHDADWADDELGASPWMSILMIDAMLHVYMLTEDDRVAEFIRRMGTFLQTACQWEIPDEHGDPMPIPMYAMLYDGTNGNPGDTMTGHQLETAAGLAWSAFFAECRGDAPVAWRQMVTNLFEHTYEISVHWWLRPDNPLVGSPAYVVSPWRKWNWEHRPSGHLSWLMYPPRIDSDADGQSDGDELRAGTDRWDVHSLFAIRNIRYSNSNEIELCWTGGTNHSFYLHGSPDLNEPFTNVLITVDPAVDGTNSIQLDISGRPSRYFMLRTPAAMECP
jgi:hypothetical protein